MSPVFMPSDGQRLERIKVEVFKILTDEIFFHLNFYNKYYIEYKFNL